MSAAQLDCVAAGDMREHRQSERASVALNLRLWRGAGDPLPDLAQSQDISASGIRLVTDLPMVPGEEISVAIPTRGCPSELGLPLTLEGKAVAKRVRTLAGNRHVVALAFHDALAQSMEMALYMAYLLGGEQRGTGPAARFA
jgi:hypothetical protein